MWQGNDPGKSNPIYCDYSESGEDKNNGKIQKKKKIRGVKKKQPRSHVLLWLSVYCASIFEEPVEMRAWFKSIISMVFI